MNEDLHDGRQKPKGGFQFTEEHMALLRSGNGALTREIEIEMAKEITRHFDSWLRAIRSRAKWLVCYEDCQDIVQEFRAKKLPEVIAKYRNLSAKHFSAEFYQSLKNHAVDWLKKNAKEILESNLSRQDQKEGTEKGFLERLPTEWEDFRNRLTDEEMADLVKAVREFILRWTEDPVKRWVLEKAIFRGMKAEEIATEIEKAFPGKVYAVGTVYSWVSRFRSSPGLWRIKKQYFE